MFLWYIPTAPIVPSTPSFKFHSSFNIGIKKVNLIISTASAAHNKPVTISILY